LKKQKKYSIFVLMNINDFISARINKLREEMMQSGINLAILAKPEHYFYFSNFNPIINSHPAFVIIPLTGEPCLLVHCLRASHAKKEAALRNIQLYGKWGDVSSIALDSIDALNEVISGCNLKHIKVGLELSFVNHNLYNKIVDRTNIDEITDITDIVDELKMVKDDYEISLLKKSADIADYGMEVIIDYLRNGYSEAMASTEAQYAMRKRWQEKCPEYEITGFGSAESGVHDSLSSWCLSGERISYGCDCSSNHIPQKGELVLPFVWAKIGGYFVENERSLYVSEISSFKMKVFKTVLDAREKVFTAIKPGVTCEYLYTEAKKVFDTNGFSNNLPGRIGHGIGLSAHEHPSLQMGNKLKLAEGMVFTVEPGLISVNWGGVRPSDTIVVTKNGYESLTKTKNGILKI